MQLHFPDGIAIRKPFIRTASTKKRDLSGQEIRCRTSLTGWLQWKLRSYSARRDGTWLELLGTVEGRTGSKKANNSQ